MRFTVAILKQTHSLCSRDLVFVCVCVWVGVCVCVCMCVNNLSPTREWGLCRWKASIVQKKGEHLVRNERKDKKGERNIKWKEWYILKVLFHICIFLKFRYRGKDKKRRRKSEKRKWQKPIGMQRHTHIHTLSQILTTKQFLATRASNLGQGREDTLC